MVEESFDDKDVDVEKEVYKITPFEKERCNLVQITPKSLHLTNWKLWSIKYYWHKANGGIENNRIP